jgi:cell division protein FtsN
MRDASRIRDRGEVRLDRVQVIWLTLGTVVALGLMFALGVVVGRRAATFDAPPPPADPIARMEKAGELHDELTFYDRLTEPKKPSPHKEVPASEPVVRQPPVGTAVASEPAGATGATVRGAVAGVPARDPVGAAEVDAEAEIRQALARGPALPGEYTIQVSAYQSMAEARAYAASLTRQGFNPFIVTANIRGKGTWYRVRLGRFANQHDANRGKTLLARSDIPAWVLRTE